MTSQPIPPSHHYADLLAERTRRLSQELPTPTSDFAGTGTAAYEAVAGALDQLRPDLASFLHDVWDYAEPAFEEHRSVERLAELLRSQGYEPEVGVAGVPTALRATAGEGGRTIGICAEYDALPGIGHACGHNVIATAGVGAFLAAAGALRQSGLSGTLVLYGTPAEEGHAGKEVMARGGAFTDIDAAIMIHGYDYDCADQVWLGRRSLTITYTGISAHASASPYAGRNALDAASLLYQGIGLMRQQTPAVDRIHAIITSGGDRPSIIPSTATVVAYVRSPHPETLRDLSERLDAAARGAAMMTGCGVEIQWDDHPPTMPVRTNQALTGRWSVHQQQRGRTPLPRGVVDEGLAASTDFGNLSYLVPGIHPLVKVAETGTALHTTDFAEVANSDAGVAAALDGAYGLACTALDFLSDDDLAAATRAEFDADGGTVRAKAFFGGAA